VYKARDIRNHEEVALKIVRQPEMFEASHQEFLIMQRISHPNIIKAIDYFSAECCSVLVMNLFAGYDLPEVLSRSETRFLPEQTACTLFRLLVDALDHLHSCEILHRDVKPENLMVSEDFSDVQLIDFNVANCKADSEPLTPHCSPLYAPPEVFDGEAPAEPADIWGAGLCLLMMLTGECNVHKGKVNSRAYLFQSSEVCKDVLKSCLSLDPSDRPDASTLLATAWLNACRLGQVAVKAKLDIIEEGCMADSSCTSLSLTSVFEESDSDDDDDSNEFLRMKFNGDERQSTVDSLSCCRFDALCSTSCYDSNDMFDIKLSESYDACDGTPASPCRNVAMT